MKGLFRILFVVWLAPALFGAEGGYLRWMQRMDAAAKAGERRDTDAQFENLTEALREADSLEPIEYAENVSLLLDLYARRKDTNGIVELLNSELEREGAKPVSDKGRLKQGYLHLGIALSDVNRREPISALASLSKAKVVLQGAPVDPLLQAYLSSLQGVVYLALKRTKDAMKELDIGIEVLEKALGIRGKTQTPASADKRNFARGQLWRLYAGSVVMRAAADRLDGKIGRGISRLEKAVKATQSRDGVRTDGYSLLLAGLAELQFNKGADKRAQSDVDQLVEALRRQNYVPISVVNVVSFSAGRAARLDDSKLMARRFAQLIPIVIKSDMRSEQLVKDCVNTCAIYGNGNWDRTYRAQRETLAAIAKEYPDQPGRAVEFMLAFAENARDVQKVDAAVAFYRDLGKAQESSVDPLNLIGALDRLARYLREQNRLQDFFPVSEQLIEKLKRRYGDDSRVSDALVLHGETLKAAGREEEAKKFSKEAGEVTVRAFRKK